MKPGDPNTLYALADGVGVFRSRDAGASWTFTSASVIGNSVFTVDPNPGHERWLYSSMNEAVHVSKDEGDTWTKLPDPGHDNLIRSAQVFVSPQTSGTLFVGYYGDETPANVLGLRKSTDGGAHWTSVSAFDGMPVQALAFAPGSQAMALATSDARVFVSPDEGVTWSQVATPPLPAGIGMTGSLTYNPYKTGELWLSSTEMVGGVFKITLTDPIPGWTRAMPSYYTSGYKVTFLGPNDVYMWLAHSTDGGTTWAPFGPTPTWGPGEYVFSPEDTRTVYFTNARVGVQKSTTGGVTGPSGEASWTVCNQGLTGMRCSAMAVSPLDPLRVYASFDGWGGVYVSNDGTNSWKYHAIDGSGQLSQVLQDPFDPALVYAVGAGLYTSTDGGETWHDWGWNGIPDSEKSDMGLGSMAADPFREGHLLVAVRVGQSSDHDHDLGYVFSSDDHGANWTSVVVTGTAGSNSPVIGDIVFDPETPGTVYLAAGGSGIFRSTDDGETWVRIDDRSPWMANPYSISIATHPQHVLLVSGDSGRPFRSFDNGLTWELKQGSGEVSARKYVFVDGDSTRLYSPDWYGLHFSSNVGDSWTNAAGALGSVQNTTLAYTEVDGHTLLYAATTGGKIGVVIAGSSAAKAATSRAVSAAPPASDMVGAGIYRRAQIETTKTFYSSGTYDGYVLESSHTSNKGRTLSSTATTFRLGDSASKQQYRSILSFGTSSIPDSAVITKVELRVRKQGVTGGGNPVTMFQGFMADMRRGYFGTSSKLQTTDFQASASRSYGAFKPALVGGWYSIDLTAAKGYVNKLTSGSGLTQIRLRFKLDDNGNRTANYLRLYSGNAPASSRPQLIVTYYMP
jgi:photosystem II stability/assembly factor-like uncharacterized protein